MELLRRILTSIFIGRSSLARKNRAITLMFSVYAFLVAVVDHWYVGHLLDIKPNLHTMLGTVLGIFLAFRTSTAYDRWWEGRKLWGQLVNDTRNLAIKVVALAKIDRVEKDRIGLLLIKFARALKDHLRETVKPKPQSPEQDYSGEPPHVPIQIAKSIRESITLWKEQGRIDGYDDVVLDPHARALMDICGACERIRKTPLARSYLHFIRQCIGLYLFTLPWGLIDDWSYWCVPATAVVAYFMIGIELLAEQVEEPFGFDEDDLRLDEICDGIEKSVREIISAGSSH